MHLEFLRLAIETLELVDCGVEFGRDAVGAQKRHLQLGGKALAMLMGHGQDEGANGVVDITMSLVIGRFGSGGRGGRCISDD